MKLNRRQTLLGMSTAMLLPAACATRTPAGRTYTNSTFVHGVASGDPGPDSVVLWTRISGASRRTDVSWRVAIDRDMSEVVASGVQTTTADRDYTVKIVPTGLSPGQRYYYRFEALGVLSPTGRTMTLPTGQLDRLVIG
ncbi:MAG: PhoD-like phosphatase N-terminal domain-containing protein, partial [Pseudomonadota bacterium]